MRSQTPEVFIPRLMERIYAWGDDEERVWAYLMGVMDATTLTFTETQMIAMSSILLRTEELAFGLGRLGFTTKTEAGKWIRDEEEVRIYGAIVEDMPFLMGVGDLWTRLTAIPIERPLEYLRGVVITSGTITPEDMLEIYVALEVRGRVEALFNALRIKYTFEKGVLETPEEIYYPPLECVGVVETEAAFFILDKENASSLLLLLGVSPALLKERTE